MASTKCLVLVVDERYSTTTLYSRCAIGRANVEPRIYSSKGTSSRNALWRSVDARVCGESGGAHDPLRRRTAKISPYRWAYELCGVATLLCRSDDAGAPAALDRLLIINNSLKKTKKHALCKIQLKNRK